MLQKIARRVFHKAVFCNFITYVLRAFECQDYYFALVVTVMYSLDNFSVNSIGGTYFKSNFLLEVALHPRNSGGDDCQFASPLADCHVCRSAAA